MSDIATLNGFEYIEVNTQINFNIGNMLEMLTATQAKRITKPPKKFAKLSKLLDCLKIIIMIPFALFFASTYISPINATDIILEDFVFDPSTEWWIPLCISAGIWIVISLIFYAILVRYNIK
jgi:hypothetical protein